MDIRLDELLGMEEHAVYRSGYRPDASVWSLTPEALRAIDAQDAINAPWISSDAVLWERYGKPYVSYLQFIDLGNRIGCIEHHEGIGGSSMFDYNSLCMREFGPYELTTEKRTDLQLKQLAKIFSRPALGGRFMLFPLLAKIAESELDVRDRKAVQKADMEAFQIAKRNLTPKRPRTHGSWAEAAMPLIIIALRDMPSPRP